MAAPRIRQPRVAEIVASRLRDDILSGRLREGDVLPSQESLFTEFGVSPPALREAIHILEIDGLVYIEESSDLKPGDFVEVEITDADAHDLWARRK